MRNHLCLICAVIAVFSGHVFAEEVKYYDNVPTLDELRQQLLGPQIKLRSNSGGARTRSFKVDDNTQQVNDSETGDRPSIGSTRIAIQERRDNALSTEGSSEGRVAADANSRPVTALAFPINFDINSTQLRPDAAKYLDLIGQLMKSSNIALLVEGHTDITGNSTANYRLSRERAYAIVNYLVDQYDIHPARLSAMGVGSTAPLNGESPTSSKNRRVQIRVRPS